MSLSLIYSLLFHLILLLLLWVQWPIREARVIKSESVPIMIDLKNVEISDHTNLPPKGVERPAPVDTKSVPAAAPVATPKVSAPTPAPEPVQPREQAPVPDAAAVVEQKRAEPKAAPKSKPAPPSAVPSKPAPAAQPKSKPAPAANTGMQSLLASVDQIAKGLPKTTSATGTGTGRTGVPTASKATGPIGYANGIEGGMGGDPTQKITISETDFVVHAIRKHWNIDAGVAGIQDMVVELIVSLDQDGRVYAVDIVDKARYNRDGVFRSVTESAQRAVYICDKLGDDSPFKIFAKRYPNEYNTWSKLRLFLTPMG